MDEFDPNDHEFKANPYSAYDRLRETKPLFFYEPWNLWFATDYQTCISLLRHTLLGHELGDRRLDQSSAGFERVGNQQALNDLQKSWMLLLDPPNHTRLRGAIQDFFAPQKVDELESRIYSVSDELVAQALQNGRCDVVDDLAAKLPLRIISELFGIPECDRHRVSRWSRAIADTHELSVPNHSIHTGALAAKEFSEYMHDLVEMRRHDRAQDLVSKLIDSESQGRALTQNELISNCILIIIAGHETTVNFLGNAVLALLKHPCELSRLRAQPELGRSAIEELLRFDSPVQTTVRKILQDFEYNGMRLSRGSHIAFMLGSANHDPRVFDSPQTLSIAREPNPHISFSAGCHYCLGAYLARLEGRIAIQTLLGRVKKITLLDERPSYRMTWSARGLNALQVQLE